MPEGYILRTPIFSSIICIPEATICAVRLMGEIDLSEDHLGSRQNIREVHAYHSSSSSTNVLNVVM